MLLSILTFIGFFVVVISLAIYKSRHEKGSEDYFLAGRKLVWYLIGFSLIASNISTEQFVGQSGSAFTNYGMAVASYEWMSAVVLVFVAWFLLPKFLKAGIFTMPEYLEYRYDKEARSVMAMLLMVLTVIVFLATVLWSGASYLADYIHLHTKLQSAFDLKPEAALFWSRWACVWAIALLGAAYSIRGGLSAVVWADLIQGSALLICGCIITFFGLQMLGNGSAVEGWSNLVSHSATQAKLNPIRPWNDPHIPWIAVFIGGLWIPNIFYWGLNQYITQRTLGAKSLAEGQKGILFAAFMKLLMPLAVILPGIITFYLVQTAGDLVVADKDACYSSFMQYVLQGKGWIVGLMFAAICGAVMSSFNAGVNSAATMFTMDIYSKYINKDANSAKQLSIGRYAAVGVVVFACLWTPIISFFHGVFQYIQEIWGFLSSGVVAVFLVGMVSKRIPRGIGKWILILGVVLYGCFRVPGWTLKTNYPDLDIWTDEKSQIICDDNYAEKKINMITNATYPDNLKRTIVYNSINIKFFNKLTGDHAPQLVEAAQTMGNINSLVQKAYSLLKDEKNEFSLSEKEMDSITVALTKEFASYGLPEIKTLTDFQNSDLIKMAKVQARALRVGFKPESDFVRFKAESFLQQVKAGNVDAINALAGYPSHFPKWGYFFTITFLHHMLIVLVILIAIMLVAGAVKPLKTPVIMPVNKDINLESTPSVYIVGIVLLLGTAGVYLIFSGIFF